MIPSKRRADETFAGFQSTRELLLLDSPKSPKKLKLPPSSVLRQSSPRSPWVSGCRSFTAKSFERITPFDGSTSSTDPLSGGEPLLRMLDKTEPRSPSKITESETETLLKMDPLYVSLELSYYAFVAFCSQFRV